MLHHYSYHSDLNRDHLSSSSLLKPYLLFLFFLPYVLFSQRIHYKWKQNHTMSLLKALHGFLFHSANVTMVTIRAYVNYLLSIFLFYVFSHYSVSRLFHSSHVGILMCQTHLCLGAYTLPISSPWDTLPPDICGLHSFTSLKLFNPIINLPMRLNLTVPFNSAFCFIHTSRRAFNLSCPILFYFFIFLLHFHPLTHHIINFQIMFIV